MKIQNKFLNTGLNVVLRMSDVLINGPKWLLPWAIIPPILLGKLLKIA